MEHAPEREPDEDRVDQTAMQREEAQRELELEENPEESKSEEAKESLSQASQIGRAAQTGGTPESGRQAGVDSREGWPMPDQSGTPKEWSEPTTDS